MMMLQAVMTKLMGHMQMMWASSMFRVLLLCMLVAGRILAAGAL
jgi:hypothetical protein